MSRLIDADVLKEKAFGKRGGLIHTSDIDAMPTIDPERKKGHWTGENACEFCGFQPWYERDIHTLSYCPNCGADMREGD